MAIMPTAHYAPINYSGVPRIRSAGLNVVIFHTIVGHDPAPAAHFSLGGYGELTQNRDTLYQSAACLDGNPRALACETEDLGAPFPTWDTNNGHEVPAWSDPQLDRAVEVCVWAYHTHGVPLQLAADSKTGSAGIAYHRQGIDSDNNFAGFAYGGRVSGGEHWSTSKGKVCPGDRRIKQLIEIVIPRARVAAGLDNDMTAEDTANIKTIKNWLEALIHGLGEEVGGGIIERNRHDYETQHAVRAFLTLAKSHGPETTAGDNATPPPFPAHGEPLPAVDLLKQMAQVVKTLPTGGVSAEEIVAAMAVNQEFLTSVAGAFADEVDRRNRDGDSATGQPS